MKWDEHTNVEFIRIYHVRPARLVPQFTVKNGGWGPILAIAWLGRMVVVGFHSLNAHKKYR